MSDILLYSIAVLIGFVVLVWAADRFILGASAIARNLGVSPLIIGLTIVGFGTSAPEMFISGLSAVEGYPALGIGNALGSNIANIALVLGVTAMITPLGVHSDTLKREFPVLIATMLLALGLLADSMLNRVDGTVLLVGMVIMILWVVRLGLQTRHTDPIKAEYSAEVPQHMPMAQAWLWLVLGLVLLLGSSKAIVWGASAIAHSFGVSDLIIGLTIVALGTSLPELAASIMSALKGEHDIAIGNIIGSNMFNLLGVLGLPGVIHPSMVEDDLIQRDFPFMIGLTFALYAMSYGFNKPGRINRLEGLVLFTAFFGYLYVIYLTSV
jgi:cation:H+ antiporter